MLTGAQIFGGVGWGEGWNHLRLVLLSGTGKIQQLTFDWLPGVITPLLGFVMSLSYFHQLLVAILYSLFREDELHIHPMTPRGTLTLVSNGLTGILKL